MKKPAILKIGLDPVARGLRSILKVKACAKAHKTVESLKRALIKAWEEIPLETLRKVIDDFPKRLNACIEAQGGYFE
jgi:hypothetical protein